MKQLLLLLVISIITLTELQAKEANNNIALSKETKQSEKEQLDIRNKISKLEKQLKKIKELTQKIKTLKESDIPKGYTIKSLEEKLFSAEKEISNVLYRLKQKQK